MFIVSPYKTCHSTRFLVSRFNFHTGPPVCAVPRRADGDAISEGGCNFIDPFRSDISKQTRIFGIGNSVGYRNSEFIAPKTITFRTTLSTRAALHLAPIRSRRKPITLRKPPPRSAHAVHWPAFLGDPAFRPSRSAMSPNRSTIDSYWSLG